LSLVDLKSSDSELEGTFPSNLRLLLLSLGVFLIFNFSGLDVSGALESTALFDEVDFRLMAATAFSILFSKAVFRTFSTSSVFTLLAALLLDVTYRRTVLDMSI
jgi:hypothetical protein